MKLRIAELGWSEMTSCAVRSSYAFARDSHEVAVQLAVGILVMKYRHGVSARRKSNELTDRLLVQNWAIDLRDSFFVAKMGTR